MSLSISAPTCQTLAEPTQPPPAIAAAIVGSRSFAMVESSTIVSTPRPMSALKSPC